MRTNLKIDFTAIFGGITLEKNSLAFIVIMGVLALIDENISNGSYNVNDWRQHMLTKIVSVIKQLGWARLLASQN